MSGIAKYPLLRKAIKEEFENSGSVPFVGMGPVIEVVESAAVGTDADKEAILVLFVMCSSKNPVTKKMYPLRQQYTPAIKQAVDILMAEDEEKSGQNRLIVQAQAVVDIFSLRKTCASLSSFTEDRIRKGLTKDRLAAFKKEAHQELSQMLQAKEQQKTKPEPVAAVAPKLWALMDEAEQQVVHAMLGFLNRLAALEREKTPWYKKPFGRG